MDVKVGNVGLFPDQPITGPNCLFCSTLPFTRPLREHSIRPAPLTTDFRGRAPALCDPIPKFLKKHLERSQTCKSYEKFYPFEINGKEATGRAKWDTPTVSWMNILQATCFRTRDNQHPCAKSQNASNSSFVLQFFFVTSPKLWHREVLQPLCADGEILGRTKLVLLCFDVQWLTNKMAAVRYVTTLVWLGMFLCRRMSVCVRQNSCFSLAHISSLHATHHSHSSSSHVVHRNCTCNTTRNTCYKLRDFDLLSPKWNYTIGTVITCGNLLSTVCEWTRKYQGLHPPPKPMSTGWQQETQRKVERPLHHVTTNNPSSEVMCGGSSGVREEALGKRTVTGEGWGSTTMTTTTRAWLLKKLSRLRRARPKKFGDSCLARLHERLLLVCFVNIWTGRREYSQESTFYCSWPCLEGAWLVFLCSCLRMGISSCLLASGSVHGDSVVSDASNKSPFQLFLFEFFSLTFPEIFAPDHFEQFPEICENAHFPRLEKVDCFPGFSDRMGTLKTLKAHKKHCGFGSPAICVGHRRPSKLQKRPRCTFTIWAHPRQHLCTKNTFSQDDDRIFDRTCNPALRSATNQTETRGLQIKSTKLVSTLCRTQINTSVLTPDPCDEDCPETNSGLDKSRCMWRTWNEHMRVSSTLIIAPALSNSPQ